jgi:hypothetical protein
MLNTPRRNKDVASRIPLGGTVKTGLYVLEQALRLGPVIEILGRKP